MNPGWAETRLGALESRVEYLIRYLQDLIPQLRSAQQSARTANQQYSTSSGGGSSGAFFCMPSSAVGAASGTWPGSVGANSFTGDVYQTNGATLTLVATAALVYNWYPVTLAPSKLCNVIPDGAGNWVVVTQSCT